ncbi:MAG TPA: ABC transporter permease, partial [Nocardioides sp.]|nr:ABC transporter permease [Nocardioides sp.]
MTILGAAESGPSCYSRFVNEWFCWQYVEDRHEQITDALVEHVLITLAALALGIAIALPLALVARRLPRLESAVLGF